MIVVRKGVFETNSSSTHSICIAKTNKINIPEKITVNLHNYEFGWEEDKRSSTEEKIAYIVIAMLNYCNFDIAVDRIKRLITCIRNFGVKSLEISGIEIHSYGSVSEPYFDTWDGYVDHGNELEDFVKTNLENDDLLKEYLFNKDSFILTGNDNNDSDININVDYEHEEFFKGN